MTLVDADEIILQLKIGTQPVDRGGNCETERRSMRERRAGLHRTATFSTTTTTTMPPLIRRNSRHLLPLALDPSPPFRPLRMRRRAPPSVAIPALLPRYIVFILRHHRRRRRHPAAVDVIVVVGIVPLPRADPLFEDRRECVCAAAIRR